MSATPRSRDTTSLSDEKEKLDLEYNGGNVVTNTLTAGALSTVTAGPETVEDERETRRIMRKIDWHILPICSLLYLFSFLDRTAIGNANVAGMSKGLGLVGDEYALALSLFFIPYGLLEVPSNIMLKKFGAKLWLPFIVVAWGIVMLLTGVVHNAGGLIAARVFLGATEAGLFPGVSVLLSFLYPRSFIQLRIGIFFSAATIAGAFGGLLSYGLVQIKSGSFAPWRFIFIVEGALTIIVGVLGYFMLVSGFHDAKWLTPQEKQYMQDRIEYDGTSVPMDNSFKWKYVTAGLADWKTWLALIAYIGSLTPLYSIALTLPSILKNTLGYTAVEAQYMTIPVYIVAAICVVIFAFLSDRTQNRSAFLILGCAISAIGWVVGLTVNNARVRYGACFLSALGSYAGFPSIVALISQNVGGQTKRATCLGILVGIGGLCGIISSNIFMPREVPLYRTAYKINIGLNCMAIVGTALKAFLLTQANRRKERMIESGEVNKFSNQELAEMGDHSPYFKYRI